MLEILDQSELGAFLYEICPNFFLFRENFPFSFSTTKYAICRYWSKNDEIAFWSKFLTCRNKRLFRKKFYQNFFFFRESFPFFSWTTKYAMCKISCKNSDIVFRPKFLTSQTKGHFLTNFAHNFLFSYYFFIELSTCFLDH